MSFTISWSLLKLMSKESVMPSNNYISVVPFSSSIQFFKASGSFLSSFDRDQIQPFKVTRHGCLAMNERIAAMVAANAGGGGRTTGALAPPNPAQGAALPHSAPSNPAQGAALPHSALPGQGPCGRTTGALAPPNPA